MALFSKAWISRSKSGSRALRFGVSLSVISLLSAVGWLPVGQYHKRIFIYLVHPVIVTTLLYTWCPQRAEDRS
jgi:hypothetical protein